MFLIKREAYWDFVNLGIFIEHNFFCVYQATLQKFKFYK